MCYISIDLTGINTLNIKGKLYNGTGVVLTDTLPQANANPGALSVASQNKDTGYIHGGIWAKNLWNNTADTESIDVDEDVPVSSYSGTYYLVLALYGSNVNQGATYCEITSVTEE